MEWRRNTLISRVGLCFAGLFLTACGGAETPVEVPDPPAPANPDLVWTDPGAGGGGGGSSGPATVSQHVQRPSRLSFRLELDRNEFEIGEPIPARLVLRNTSDRPVRIYDPKRCLPADLTFKIYTPDRRTLEVKEHKDIREQSVTEEDLVTMAPGASEFVEFDLAPTLHAAGQGQRGGYRVWATFTGGYQGKSLTRDVWNRSGGKSLEAPLALLSLSWPDRLAKQGVTPEVDARVTELLSRVGRDMRPPRAARRELEALGPAMNAALVAKLSSAAARKPSEQLIGWSAFYLLRDAGDATLTALTNAPEVAKTPIGRMLAHLVDADLRRRQSRKPTPVDTKFLYLLLDPDRRSNAVLRVTRVGNERTPRDVFTVLGDGSLVHERDTKPEKTIRTGRLETKQLESLLRTVADQRLWLLRPVRNSGASAETRMTFEILENTGAADKTFDPLWRLDVWETEATRFNRPLAAVLTALGEAKLALKR